MKYSCLLGFLNRVRARTVPLVKEKDFHNLKMRLIV
jgi:hypothetical protein